MEPRTAHPSAQPSDRGVFVKTLLLTDLIDSTQLVERLGDDEAYELLSRHDRMARDLLEAHDGKEIDKTDGFLLLFDRPVDAVRYALAYHQELRVLSAEHGVQLQARAGIHLGEVHLHDNTPEDVRRGAKPLEIEGLAKPLTARVASLAAGGQTLLTQSAFELSRRAMAGEAADVRWLAHGNYLLKGMEDPVPIFEVGTEGLAPLSPPASTEKARRSSRLLRTWLPILLLVLAAAAAVWFQFVRTPAHERRPTVAVFGFKNLGPEGAEWLATALAETLAVELAVGEELRLIPGESVSRVERELALSRSDSLASDTLRHVRERLAADYVVVGSYILMEQAGEQQLSLQLRLQDARDAEIVAAVNERGSQGEFLTLVSNAGAVIRERLGLDALSSEQARAVEATFSASPEATEIYSEGLAMLRRYDAVGARDRFLEAVEIDPDFALGHAALSESWAALGYDSRAEESARHALSLSDGLPREQLLSIQGRYYDVASNLQGAVDTYRQLWEAHSDNLDHGLKLVQALTRAGRLDQALAVVEELRRLPAPDAEDPRIDLSEEAALRDVKQRLQVLERAVEKGRVLRSWIVVAQARFRQGRVHVHYGEPEKASEALHEARTLFEQAGDRVHAAECLNQIAIAAKYEGRLSDAESLYLQALATQREIGARGWTAYTLNNLAVLTREKGEIERAAGLLEDALPLSREIGNRSLEAQILENLAGVLVRQGRPDRARQVAERALAIATEDSDDSTIAWSQFDLGQIAVAAGAIADGRTAYERALAISESIGYDHLTAYVLHEMGRLLLISGDLPGAERHLDRSQAIRDRLGERENVVRGSLTRAQILLESGRSEAADTLAREAVETLRTGERVDDLRVAYQLLARILTVEGKLEEARAVLATPPARVSENPSVRLSATITESRLLVAEGDAGAALSRLAPVLAEAQRLGLVGLELEARLARGEAELASGDTRSGHATLAALVQEARNAGFGLIASRAEARL